MTTWTVMVLGWSALANLALGDAGYTLRNLALTGLLLLVARRMGFSPADLGMSRAGLRDGLRWGVAALAVVGAVLVVAGLLAPVMPAVEALLDDQRADLQGRALAFAVLVRIPVGTALFEEVLFRGLLLAIFLRHGGHRFAIIASSVVFGLWHIPPTIVALRLNDVVIASGAGVAAIAGAVVVTSLAGLAFNWLRIGSASLAAPMIAHWATNGLGLLAAAAV